MTFTTEQVKAIHSAAMLVGGHALYQAEKNDCLDNPTFCACEIIDLVEWCSASLPQQSAVAKLVLDNFHWPIGTSKPVRDYFNLAY